MVNPFPVEFIETLLERTDIVDLISVRIKLKKAGTNFTCCCPFHQEKTPSFIVFPKNQNFHCFGCRAHGDAITFLRQFEQKSYSEAVEYLANQSGLNLPTDPGQQFQKKHDYQEYYELLQKVAKFYAWQLKHHANRGEPVNYLKKRGISGETAKDFLLGFAPPERKILKEFFKDLSDHERFRAVGMLLEKNNEEADKFKNRLMFPIRDYRGRIVGFGGRTLKEDGIPKYLNSNESVVFHKGRLLYGLYEATRVQVTSFIVVEGYMDVLALVQAGFKNAVGTLGTALTESQIKFLFKYAPKIYFCFDGDEAGKKAAWRSLEQITPYLEDGLQALFVFLPEEHDPDSYINAYGKAAFEKLFEKAVPYSSFFFHHLSQGLNLEVIEERSILASRCNELLNKLPEGTFRELLQNSLSELIHMPITTLRGAPLPARRREYSESVIIGKNKGQTPAPLTLAYALITLLMQAPKWVDLLPPLPLPLQADFLGKALLERIIAWLREEPEHLESSVKSLENAQERQLLEKLMASPRVLSIEALETEVKATWERLVQAEFEYRIETLLAMAKERALSQEEKEELQHLLQQKGAS